MKNPLNKTKGVPTAMEQTNRNCIKTKNQNKIQTRNSWPKHSSLTGKINKGMSLLSGISNLTWMTVRINSETNSNKSFSRTSKETTLDSQDKTHRRDRSNRWNLSTSAKYSWRTFRRISMTNTRIYWGWLRLKWRVLGRSWKSKSRARTSPSPSSVLGICSWMTKWRRS